MAERNLTFDFSAPPALLEEGPAHAVRVRFDRAIRESLELSFDVQPFGWKAK